MAIQKNFVIKNGLEVNDNLIFADAVNNKVGINTSIIQYELDVKGDIGASTVYTDDLIISGGLGIGNSFGSEGSYLISTGTGVTWSSTSGSRISQTYIATEGQDTFSFTYNPSIGVDVFVNGVRLSPSSYTATDGVSVILNVSCFEGDNVDLIAYSVSGIGAGITGITGITVLNEGISIGNDSNITSLNFVGSGVTASLSGFGATITVNSTGEGGGESYWSQTTAGIHTLSNVGIGTTNPTTALEISGNIRFSDNNIKIGDPTVGENLELDPTVSIASLDWTGGTTIFSEADASYILTGLSGNLNGTNLSITVTRDSNGDIVSVTPNSNGDGNFVYTEQVLILGSLIGGVDGVDDIIVTIEESYSSGSGNIFMGLGVGRHTTTGGYNNFFGDFSGYCNTTGYGNNFFGFAVGKNNTEGYYNNFFGGYSGYCNTTGINNNFFGRCAGYYNTTGGCNNFFGRDAGYNNTNGSYNNFFGPEAGYNNTNGSYNNFFGLEAGNNNTTGEKNHYIGYLSGYCNTTGSYNIILGDYSYGPTTGDGNFLGGYAVGYGGMEGSYNNFFGWYAGSEFQGCYNNIIGFCGGYYGSGLHNNFFGSCSGLYNTGDYNIFLGKCSGYINAGNYNNFFGTYSGNSNTTGYYNNFFGYKSGCSNTTGSYNNIFGRFAGGFNTIGCYNNFFGSSSGYLNTTGNYNIFLGAYTGISNSASHKVIIGSGFYSGVVNSFDSPDTTKDRQFAVGVRTDTNPSKYWIVGDENFNVGIGTTNPQYKLDVGETIRIKGFIESQNASTISNNILSLDATQGTVFTHTTSANIGIVSFTGISTNRASTQTFTVLVTQGAIGYNTTAATGIGTMLATVVTDTNVAISTHIKVGSGTTIILTNSAGALDVLTFVVSYNGVGIASTNFTIIGFAATDFRGVI